MSTSPRVADQETYDAVTSADDEDETASETFTTDAIELLESKRPALSTNQVVPTGSLSRDERHSWYFVGHGAADAIMTLGPVLFLVVPGMCLGLNKEPISAYGETVKAITLLSPTIFPIIYAAILGKLLRRIGLFNAERGTTLGNLERLIGCQSVFSTIERQVGLWHFDALGISILIAWLLSPLGGQASLRLLSTKPLISTHNITVKYYPLQEYPQKSYIRSAELAQENWPLYGPLYMTAVQTSRQSLLAPMDLFGHVKIPDINYLGQKNDSATNSDSIWQYVSNTTLASYTSILGVPVVGVPDGGNCSFNLVSHYWAVDCQSLYHLPGPSTWPPVPASRSNRTASSADRTPTFHIRVDDLNSAEGHVMFEYLSVRQEPFTDILVTTALCSASPTVVESRVRCRDRSCAVRAVRRAQFDPAKLWRNTPQTSPTASSVFRSISEWMPGADLGSTQGIISTSELIEHWMVDPDLSTLGNPLRPYVDFEASLPLANFTRRLQAAINTFWDASIGSGVRLSDVQRSRDNTTWINTNAVVTQNEGDVYACNTGLAILTIAISLALFVAANISLLLGLITRTPDILGFVSSAASDNPYFKRHVATSLSGLETSRALRDVRVRVGDVKAGETVGHVALATMDANPKKLSWTRLYD